MTSTTKRAKNLDDADITQIVEMVDGWSGKLSWEMLIDAIEERSYMRYTRQALHKHERIGQAYSQRKKSLSQQGVEKDISNLSPELQVAQQQLSRLTAENSRLKAENERLLEQFVRWAYNAYSRNIDKEFLNQPLPSIDRDVTKQKIALKITTKK
jgi:regulator of replication initiation timing